MVSSLTGTASLAALVFAVGCTPSAAGVDANAAPGPDTSGPIGPDVSPPAPDAGGDRPTPADAGPGDSAAEVKPDAQADVAFDGRSEAPALDTGPPPKPWPPPGTEYLIKLASEADYDQLEVGSRGFGVPFIMRRRGNDQGYPYPWDSYECVFEPAAIIHLQFLEKMDRDRAVPLYYGEVKSAPGSLISGRFTLVKTNNMRSASVEIENTTTIGGLGGTVFPIAPDVAQMIRDRIMRCAPFVTTFNVLIYPAPTP